MTELLALPFALFLLGLYFLPTIAAYSRRHPMLLPILIINLAFGWTMLGWVVAIAWAFAADGRGSQPVTLSASGRCEDCGRFCPEVCEACPLCYDCEEEYDDDWDEHEEDYDEDEEDYVEEEGDFDAKRAQDEHYA